MAQKHPKGGWQLPIEYSIIIVAAESRSFCFEVRWQTRKWPSKGSFRLHIKRSVAQFGRALRSGRRGRPFESGRFDTYDEVRNRWIFNDFGLLFLQHIFSDLRFWSDYIPYMLNYYWHIVNMILWLIYRYIQLLNFIWAKQVKTCDAKLKGLKWQPVATLRII